MLDKFFELLGSIWAWLIPFIVIFDFEAAIKLRLGRYSSDLSPGFHWIVPFGVDVILRGYNVTQTSNLEPQSLTTKDGKSVIISVVLVYRVRNMKRFHLEVEGPEQALSDCVYGEVSRAVLATTWKDLVDPVTLTALKVSVSTRALKFGIKVEDLLISDLVLARSIRLWHSYPTGHGEEVI